MKARFTEVVWLETHPDLRLSELAELSGLPEGELHALTDYGVLSPVDPKAAELSYRAECIVVARRALRLRQDLELNTEALALVLKLMTRLERLEAKMQAMQAQAVGGADDED